MSPTVSWHSAFWAMVSLALNAMTQSSAADNYLPAILLSEARSSPIVCVADLIVTLFWTIEGLRRGDSLWVALASARHHLQVGDADPFEKLERGVPAARLVFFILGPLPQAVKLWGMRGLPLTTTVGSVYMGVYLLNIALSFCPPPDAWPATKPTGTEQSVAYFQWSLMLSITKRIYQVAFLCQFGLWVIVLAWAAPHIISIAVALIVAGVGLAFIASHLSMYWQNGNRVAGYAALAITVLNFLGMTLELLSTVDEDEKVMKPPTWKVALPFHYVYMILGRGCILGFLVFMIAILIGLIVQKLEDSVKEATKVLRRHHEGSSSQRFQNVHGGTIREEEAGLKDWSIPYAVINTLCAFIYYRYLYNEEGTSKPAWAGMLG